MARVTPIDPVEHVGQLRRRYGNAPVRRRRPQKTALLEPLGIERHAEPVVPDNLDQIAAAPPKNIEVAGMRVPSKRLLDLQSQALHPATHIRPADRQPDPDLA